jgi:hypothetical protein
MTFDFCWTTNKPDHLRRCGFERHLLRRSDVVENFDVEIATIPGLEPTNYYIRARS